MPSNHAPLPLEPFASKTLSFSDLAHPAVAPTAGRLKRFALRLGLAGTPFAVNGILRWRLWVQKHKLWEYARGAAFLQAACEGRASQPGGESRRVLDFGGGATLPVLYLASLGWEVLSLDISPALTEWTNALARRHDWKLLGSTHDLTRSALSAELGGPFDAAVSFSVLEELPAELQQPLLRRLAALLKPGGVLALTFDYGADAPAPAAVRAPAQVEEWVAATGLRFAAGDGFVDTGERFVLDRRFPDRRFAFASLFLRKPG